MNDGGVWVPSCHRLLTLPSRRRPSGSLRVPTQPSISGGLVLAFDAKALSMSHGAGSPIAPSAPRRHLRDGSVRCLRTCRLQQPLRANLAKTGPARSEHTGAGAQEHDDGAARDARVTASRTSRSAGRIDTPRCLRWRAPTHSTRILGGTVGGATGSPPILAPPRRHCSPPQPAGSTTRDEPDRAARMPGVRAPIRCHHQIDGWQQKWQRFLGSSYSSFSGRSVSGRTAAHRGPADRGTAQREARMTMHVPRAERGGHTSCLAMPGSICAEGSRHQVPDHSASEHELRRPV